MSLLLLFGQAAAVTYSKTGTVAARTKAAGADVYESAETGALVADTLLSAADAFAATETGTTAAGTKLAGSARAGFVSKLGTVATGAAATGADAFTAAKTGTVAADTTTAGSSQLGAVSKTGSVAAAAWSSGADVYTATETGAVKAAAKLTGFTRPAPGPTGKFVLTNAKVVINGVDVSPHPSTVKINLEREEIDVTPLGSQYKVFMDGPQTGTFSVSLFADPLVLTPAFWTSLDAPVTVSVTPRNAPTAPENPTWTGTAITVSKTPLTGQVGEAATASAELRSVGEVVQLES